MKILAIIVAIASIAATLPAFSAKVRKEDFATSSAALIPSIGEMSSINS